MEFVFWLLAVIGILFTLLIYFDKFERDDKYKFLGVMIAGIVVYSWYFKLDLGMMGFRWPSMESAVVYSLITAAGLIVCGLVDSKNKIKLNVNKDSGMYASFIFYALVSVPLQEINSRGFEMAVFAKLGWDNLILYVLLTSFVFSFSHLFLKNRYFVFFTFLLGLVYGLAFFFYQDLISISISHLVLATANVNLTRNVKNAGL